MKKLNKKLLGWFSLILPVTATAVAAPLSISHTTPQEVTTNKTSNSATLNSDNKKIIYDGKYYSSVDQAADDVLANSKIIQDKFMIGDLQDAIFDTQTKRLDESKLKDYDISRLSKVYQTASGKYTSSYEDAKQSFVNNALVTEAYDDLNGNIFYNENDALNSLRSHTQGVPVPYYTVTTPDGVDVKINPLNQYDINKFKSIAASWVANQTLGGNNFKLELYLKDQNGNYVKSDLGSTNSSNNTDSLYKNNDISSKENEIADAFVQVYKDEILKNVFSKVNTSLNVSFKSFGSGHWKWGWQFDFNGRRSSSITLTQNNGRPLTLADIINSPSNQKNTIYAFLNRNTLEHSSKEVHVKINNSIAPVFGQKVATEFYGVDVYGNKFSIYFTGDDAGESPGIDFELLKRGTEGKNADWNSGYNVGSTRFDLSLSFDSNNLRSLMNNFLTDDNLLSEFKQNFISKLVTKDSNFNESVLNKLTNADIADMLSKIITNLNDSHFINNTVDFNTPYKKDAPDVDATINSELSEQVDELNNSVNTWLYQQYGKTPEKDFRSNVQDNIDTFDKLFLGINKNNSTYNNDNAEIMITYYGNPIFSLKNEYDVVDKNGQVIKKDLFDSYNINDIRNQILNGNQDIIDAFENVSSKYVPTTVDGKTVLQYTNKSDESDNLMFSSLNKDSNANNIPIITPDDVDNLYNTFNKTQQEFKDDLEAKSNFETASPNAKLNSSNGIALALYGYAKRLKEIGYDQIINNPTRFDNLITNFNDDVLTLKDNSGQWLPINYAEFLGTGDSINSPLSNDTVSIYETSNDRQQMLKQNKNLKPAKVIAIYDLDGKVVNSDFRLDGSEFGDGSYDDRQTVINNALNTVIVNQAQDLVFYKDDDGKNILIKNEVNEVYELTLDNKNYYYPTFDDAKNELITYIKNNCTYI